MGTRRRLAAVASVVALGTGAVAGVLVWRAHDAGASTTCTSLVSPDRTVEFAGDLPRRARQSMFTFGDVRPATRGQRDAIYARRFAAAAESPDARPDALLHDGVCTATYTGPGHRPSPEAHRRGARVVAVADVTAIVVVHRDRTPAQPCYGPVGACNGGLLKDVTCLRFYDASSLVSLGSGWCFDDAPPE